MPPAASFSVVAIVSAYNEADIIDQVVTDLVQHGVSVYFIDDGSTDDTVDIVRKHLNRGVIGMERTRPRSPGDEFDWSAILERKAQLASELEADWFIHNDADELRDTPWQGMTLASAIRRVDALGYNAIDSVRLDFWPVHDDFRPGDNLKTAFQFYGEPAPFDRVQVRCWKRTDEPVDLVSSGGHDVRFPGRRVFPIPFLLRHYPIRTQAHGLRKVLGERRPRFARRERAMGWHIQYDHVQADTSFIRDADSLTAFDLDAIRIELALRHRDVERLHGALTDLEAAHAALTTSLASQAEALAVVQAEADECRQEALRRREELDEVRRSRAAAERHLERLTHELGDRDRRLISVYESRTWRWTAPLRSIVDFVTGR